MVKTEEKYNTLLLIQLLLLLNSTINPLIHYWRNRKIRGGVNSFVRAVVSAGTGWRGARSTKNIGEARASASNRQDSNANSYRVTK